MMAMDPLAASSAPPKPRSQISRLWRKLKPQLPVQTRTVSEKPCSIQEDGLIILARLDSGRHHLHDVQPKRNSKRAFWNITIAWISRIANLYNPTTPTSLENQDRKMQDQGDDKYAIHAAAREGKSESLVKGCLK